MFNKIKTSINKVKNKNSSKTIQEKIAENYNSYIYTSGTPIWSDKNYNNFANEAYRKNVIAHRAMRMVAQAAASIPFTLYKYFEDEKHLLERHPILDMLSNPNPTQGSKEFMESIYIYKQLSGDAYILMSGMDENNKAAELYSLRPDRITIIAGDNLLPSGYRYSVDSSNITYPVDSITGLSNILHIKTFNPLSDWYGLSAVESALYSIDQHNQAGAWNQTLLQNAARPSGAIVVKNAEGKPMSLNETERHNLRESIEETFCGSANAGRPILLEGGLEWKEMSWSPRDMDYISSKNNSAREIALAFGVPPQLLGIPGDNTYANLVEARVALWEQTIIPMVESVVSKINTWITSYFDEDLYLSYNINEVSSLADRVDTMWNRLEKSNFLTRDEKRKAAGFSPIDSDKSK